MYFNLFAFACLYETFIAFIAKKHYKNNKVTDT